MQHYTFAVNAFVELVKQFGMDEYEFAVHGTKTHQVIEDVRNFKVRSGSSTVNDFNHNVLAKNVSQYGLGFTNFSTVGSTFICGRGILWRSVRRSRWEELKNIRVCPLNREEITLLFCGRRF